MRRIQVGALADEVIKAQDAHLRDKVASGDTTHASALSDVSSRWKHPIAGNGLVPRG